jgi:hypothetical protein
MTAILVGWEEQVDTRIVEHYTRAMKNVTITLDEEVARWARIWAAEHETSVSRMVGEVLRERMLRERDYGTAMEEYLGSPAQAISGGAPYPSRGELHDRDIR